jgi:hypothetical protein
LGNGLVVGRLSLRLEASGRASRQSRIFPRTCRLRAGDRTINAASGT